MQDVRGCRRSGRRYGREDCQRNSTCEVPARLHVLSTPRLTVNGAPDCAVRIALTRQPPKAASVKPPAPTAPRLAVLDVIRVVHDARPNRARRVAREDVAGPK